MSFTARYVGVLSDVVTSNHTSHHSSLLLLLPFWIDVAPF